MFSEAETRLKQLQDRFCTANHNEWQSDNGEFFELCFERNTLKQILYLRSVLDWRRRKDDRFIAALCLGALHGESHRSPQLLQQPHAANDQHKAPLFSSLVAKTWLSTRLRVMYLRYLNK